MSDGRLADSLSDVANMRRLTLPSRHLGRLLGEMTCAKRL
ncbi:MAG: hypothetical protein ACJAV2_003472 [Myxococcota bacterium]|jgi:hypothetical protein